MTSLRQGRSREGGSGGSQRQSCEPTNRNVIEGRDSWVSWHTTTKPPGAWSTVNEAVVQRQFTVLSGEDCPGAAWRAKEVGLSAIAERAGYPTESYGETDGAADGNVKPNWVEVSRGHRSCISSEGPNSVN